MNVTKPRRTEGLAQHESSPFSDQHQLAPSHVEQPTIDGKGDGLLLHRGVDDDPPQIPFGAMAFSDTEVSPVGTLGSSLNDGFIALPEYVLEVQQPEHQSDRQAQVTRCACLGSDELGRRAEQVSLTATIEPPLTCI